MPLIVETSILRDGTRLTYSREKGENYGQYIFSDGFKCYTDKRATALSWHRDWIKKNKQNT